MRRRYSATIGVLILGCLTCGSPAQAARTGSVYQIQVSEDLSAVQVQVELAPGVTALEARDGDPDRLADLMDCRAQTIRPAGRRIPTAGARGCLRYRYPLVPQSGRRNPPVQPGVVVTAPSEWLWTPRLASGDAVRIELSLPTAVSASVPWRRLAAQTYELTASPGSATGSAVFGPIEILELPVGSAQLRVAALDGPDLGLDHDKVLDWLGAAAGDVAGVAGSFPNPQLQIIVQPVTGRRNGSPVPFGFVIRDGGEAVRFFVDPARPLADYLGDWTATHEFAHLLLPYVRGSEKWVSEGFASYYQNVLLARRGVYTGTDAWRRLHRSFGKAARIADPPPLSRIDGRPFWEVRMLIYWSGAALALEADTRLRAASGGRESLDSALARLSSCCLPSDRVWRARELFEKLDSLVATPLFVELYESYSKRRGMPDLDPLFEELGIRAEDDQVRLTGQGRLTWVRDAIMAGTPGA